MYSISDNGIITLNRGDYFSVPLFINAGDTMEPVRYVLEGDDKVYLSVMEANTPFECGVIRKVFTKEDLNEFKDVQITLETSDTDKLLPGKYYYSIKLVSDDIIDTIIPNKLFYIID